MRPVKAAAMQSAICVKKNGCTLTIHHPNTPLSKELERVLNGV